MLSVLINVCKVPQGDVEKADGSGKNRRKREAARICWLLAFTVGILAGQQGS